MNKKKNPTTANPRNQMKIIWKEHKSNGTATKFILPNFTAIEVECVFDIFAHACTIPNFGFFFSIFLLYYGSHWTLCATLFSGGNCCNFRNSFRNFPCN